jgi:uncharacterized membrane protein YfcA
VLTAEHADLAALVLGLIVTGCCGGFLAGLLGVGGGIVVVPILFHVLEMFGVDQAVRMQVAVGTSLATIIPTSIVSAWSHRRRQSVDRRLVQNLAPATFIGVVIGTLVASWVSGQVLTGVFASVALLVAVKMAMGADSFVIRSQLPGRFGIGLIGVIIGSISAMMGIGGGTLTVPVLTSFRYPIHSAVGTAAALGLVISLVGAIGFVIIGYDDPLLPPFSLGYANVAGFLAIVPASILTAPLGVRVAHAISREWLSRTFAFFLVLTSVKLFLSLIDMS